MKSSLSIIAFAITSICNVAAQSPTLHAYTPFASRLSSPSENTLTPGFSLTDREGNDHTILVSSQTVPEPVFFYSKNNEPPRALIGTENANTAEQFALFAEKEGLRLFFTSSTSQAHEFFSLKIGNASENFEPVDLLGISRLANDFDSGSDAKYTVTQAPDRSYRIGQIFKLFNAVTYTVYLSDGETTTDGADYSSPSSTHSDREQKLDLFVDDSGLLHSFFSFAESDATEFKLYYQTSRPDETSTTYSIGELVRTQESDEEDAIIVGSISQDIAVTWNSANEPRIALRDTIFSTNSIGVRSNGSWTFTDYPFANRAGATQSRHQAYLNPLGRPSFLIDVPGGGFQIIRQEPFGNFVSTDLPLTSANSRIATSVGPQKSPHFVRSVEQSTTAGLFVRSQRVRYLDATDLDGDGQSYLVETAYGSDPDNSNFLSPTPRYRLVNGLTPQLIADVPTGYSSTAFGVFRNANLGISFRAELSNDLKTWSLPLASVNSEVTNSGGLSNLVVTQTETVENNAAYRFMRYRIVRDD